MVHLTFGERLFNNHIAREFTTTNWVWYHDHMSYLKVAHDYYHYKDIHLHIDFIDARSNFVLCKASQERKLKHWDIYAFDELFLLGEVLPPNAATIKTFEDQAVINL